MGTLSDSWVFSGWLSSRNIDIYELEPAAALNLIYFWATEDADPAEVEKWDRRLWMPPKGERAEEGPWSPEAETASLAGLAASLNVTTVLEKKET